MDMHQRIINIIRKKDTQLPTLPMIVDKILGIARSESSSAQQLADVVEKDQAMSGKLLKLSNSAYFGFMKEIDTISRAITIVGFNEVIGLTIGMNVFSTFDKKDTQGIFDLEGLWLHAIACATAARGIAKRKRIGDMDKIFLTALLHDMGKLILTKYIPDAYGEVFDKALENGSPLYRVEKEMLGINHADVTGLIMKKWNIPDDLLLPCMYHHRSDQCPTQSRSDAAIIELSDYLCGKAKMGHGGNGSGPNLESLQKRLKMSSSEMDFILDTLKEQRTSIEEFLEIMK